MSLEKLRARLGLVDAPMLERVDPDNPRRLARAIAVMETTGRSLAAWQAETTEPVLRDYRAYWLQRPKAELEARIEARVAAMLTAGWVEEVSGLIRQHGTETVARFPGIGYREIAELPARAEKGDSGPRSPLAPSSVAGELNQSAGGSPADPKRAALRRDISVATRQYAKRQLTWFRREPTLLPVTLSGAALVPPALLSL
jgi:tRNA dimethylallyltransferase